MNKTVTSQDSAAFVLPAGGHVTLVVNLPKGFDLVVSNLHPTAALDIGTQMDSGSDKISLLSIPVGAEAKMDLTIRDEAQHSDTVFLIPCNTGVSMKLEKN